MPRYVFSALTASSIHRISKCSFAFTFCSYFLGGVDINDQICLIDQTEENNAVDVRSFVYVSCLEKFLNIDHTNKV